jgi:hypothetical protein
MLISTKTQAFDGDYQIIFSDTFNLFENRLVLVNIVGYTFEFLFDQGSFDQANSSISSAADDKNKKVTINIKNFRNQLGAANLNKIAILSLGDGRNIYLSIFGKSLQAESNLLQVTINFYLK